MTTVATGPTRVAKPIAILVAEDSKYDRMILEQAFSEIDSNVRLYFVNDGEDALDYLRSRNAYAAAGAAPRPALLLMDLNMPRMNGHEAVRALRADNTLRVLPVIVLSTSDDPVQIAEAYANGVNAFMTKPGHFDDVVALLRKFSEFWLTAIHLPPTVPTT
jgi:two-component system response regulator